VEHVKQTDHNVRPYQELAAAVILRALLDFQPGPNRKEQTAAIQTEARDFLCGNGEFQKVRSIWCLWSGIRPESLTNFVSTTDGSRDHQLILPDSRDIGGRIFAELPA
jgi:hypothetical protein